MNALLWAALLSMSPVWELRAGLPFALAAGINPWLAYFVCVAANTLAIFIVYFFLELIHRKLLHVNSYQTAFDKFMERTRRKAHPYVEKYGAFGLVLLVSVPVPGTGAYAGTLAGWFLGISRWKVFLSVFIGILIAGVFVTGIFNALKLLVA